MLTDAPAIVAYTACPLCAGPELLDLMQVERNEPEQHPELPGTLAWRGCGRCGHVFSAGYLDEATRADLLRRVPVDKLPGANAEHGRLAAARLVERVGSLRSSCEGRWLAVGFGDGAVLATAEEFGFQTLGLELRAACMAGMRELGYETTLGGIEELRDEAGFDVISLEDTLERAPFPAETLAAARALLREQGLLVITTPNLQTLAWRALQQQGENPYWTLLEHHHHFSREHLAWLLERSGFEPLHYAVSLRLRSGMELIARRA